MAIHFFVHVNSNFFSPPVFVLVSQCLSVLSSSLIFRRHNLHEGLAKMKMQILGGVLTFGLVVLSSAFTWQVDEELPPLKIATFSERWLIMITMMMMTMMMMIMFAAFTHCSVELNFNEMVDGSVRN